MTLPDDLPLCETVVESYIRHQFTEVLNKWSVYLANHSLGRPPNETIRNVQRAVAEWTEHLDQCWEGEHWMAEVQRFRSLVADLVGLPRSDCVLPKTSAGQGLRAVLNALPLDRKLNIVTTTGEFDSIDFILKTYEAKGRASVTWIEPSEHEGPVPLFSAQSIIDAVQPDTDLVVVSSVYFTTGQVLRGLEEIVGHAHGVGALALVDAYHAVGVFPFDMAALDADFVIGGCYKYLRGGPGACYLAIHPRVVDEGKLQSLDTGWFAKRDTFSYQRPRTPEFAEGGDAWLESTPPVLTAYQATPGLAFTHWIGVERIREYGLDRLARLRHEFAREGVALFEPHDPTSYGAFALLPSGDSGTLVQRLKDQRVTVDARGGFVRFGPDVLTTELEIQKAAKATSSALV